MTLEGDQRHQKERTGEVNEWSYLNQGLNNLPLLLGQTHTHCLQVLNIKQIWRLHCMTALL